MKRVLSILFLLWVTGGLYAQFIPGVVASSKKNAGIAYSQYLGVSTHLVNHDSEEMYVKVDLCSNVEWTATSSEEWLKEAGYILGFPGASKEVSIRAYDGSNNYAEIKFLVTLVDTIPPVIHVFDTIMLVDKEMERIGRLYDQADLAVARKMQEFDDNFPYEELGVPRSDSIYHKQTMIISVAPALAMTGKGYRFWHWGAVGDTIVIK